MLIGLTVATLAAMTGQAQDPQFVLQTMHERQQQRWSTVQNYTVVQRFTGTAVPIFYERMEVEGEWTFRVVPQVEWERARTGLSREQTEAIAEGMATGLDMIGDGYTREVGGAGGATIKSMTGELALFLREVRKYDENETRRDAAQAVSMARAFASRARLTGQESVDGRPAHVVRAEGLSDIRLEQPSGGPEFRLERVTLWIDTAESVPLRLVMETRVAGAASPVIIELQERGYQQFGPLYEPTRRILRLQGMQEAMATDPKQKRELEKARAAAEKSRDELARMEQQLASMPPAQRRMIEGQLTKARQQMETLLNQGVFEVELELGVIGINQGPPLDWKPGS